MGNDMPIVDFLMRYSGSGTLRCHKPGHKGICPQGLELPAFEYDITEISGADSLFEADGIIARSEKNMAELYGTAGTVYSAAGSTLCIQTMLALMKQENRYITAVRNVHSAFLNAAALLDMDVEWLIPDYCGGLLSGRIRLEAVENSLSKYPGKGCLYVTSPDYTGRSADIPALSAICKKHGARLIVDNAHGAHLAFFSDSRHPIALGADMCCDSAHKMLPALTGAAMLHTSDPELGLRMKQTMRLFASTSPSYLVMASLDMCNKYISERIREDIGLNLSELERLRRRFSDRLSFADGEPFHVTIEAARSGLNGNELAERLRENGVECEYSDSGLVILLMSPMCRSEHYLRLTAALDGALAELTAHEAQPQEFFLPEPQRRMSIREAVFAPSEVIPVENSAGRICASVKVPCPPAVPIAVSGEIITPVHVNIFKRYGISSVNVVK